MLGVTKKVKKFKKILSFRSAPPLRILEGARSGFFNGEEQKVAVKT